MKALLEINTPANCLSCLQLFYDTIESHIRGLAALGKCEDSYGAILLYLGGRQQMCIGIWLMTNLTALIEFLTILIYRSAFVVPLGVGWAYACPGPPLAMPLSVHNEGCILYFQLST